MQVEVGAILEGKVTAIKDYGAFVALAPDFKKSGMVHISEVSEQYVDKIENYLKREQMVKVKVLSIDEKGKIALSMKAVEPTTQQRPYNDSTLKEKPQKTATTVAPPPVYTVYTAPKKENPQKQAEPKDPFEEMMSQYKSRSEEKISDLRKNVDHRRGGGFSRKNNHKF